MNHRAVITICFLLAVSPTVGQERSSAPFVELDRQVKEQSGGWDGDKSKLSAIFDKERRQLGDRFEIELLKYIAGDVEKHYWISSFLQWPDYLHGSKPLPHLSLLIRQQGLALLRGKTDEESVGRSLSFYVLAAVQSQKLGFGDLTSSYKTEAEQRLVKNPNLRGYFPALSEDETKIYDTLPSGTKRVRSSTPTNDFADRPKTCISAGVLNSRATTLPIPNYPASREASGDVVIAIVYDETGKVIWARAVSGPLLLQKPAEDAARKATFPPFTFEGKPEKVYGILVYRFIR